MLLSNIIEALTTEVYNEYHNLPKDAPVVSFTRNKMLAVADLQKAYNILDEYDTTCGSYLTYAIIEQIYFRIQKNELNATGVIVTSSRLDDASESYTVNSVYLRDVSPNADVLLSQGACGFIRSRVQWGSGKCC